MGTIEESDVTTRKWAYNPSIGVLGYGAIPYEGRTIILFYFIFFYGLSIRQFKSAPNPLIIILWR